MHVPSAGDELTSLVLPTYNPGPRRLERTWREVQQFRRQTQENWEILFVCDGCTDGTLGLLEKLTQNDRGWVRILSDSPNRGKGHAVRHGLEAARGRWRLFTDVDLAYGFPDILRVAETLRGGAEVAIASRLHPQSRLLLPPKLLGYVQRRHLQSLAFSALVRRMLPLTVRDTQAGLKGISARAARILLPHLHCDGFGFDCELLTACMHYHVPITEVPVCVRYDDNASTAGFFSFFQTLRELWKIRQTWKRVSKAASLTRRKDDGRQAA